MPKRPPDYYWLPSEGSDGRCYHGKVCGAHLLDAVPRDEALERIEAENLDPCGHCQNYHDMQPIGGDGQ